MSTANFTYFAAAVAEHFRSLSAGPLFRVNITGDDLWDAYIAAFPEGTNPIFRVRTAHEGSYDRNFIRQLGNVVRINPDNTLSSIWSVPSNDLDFPYHTVAKALDTFVCTGTVEGLFRTKESKYGYVRTFEKREGEAPIEWFHFNAVIPGHLMARSPAEVCGEANNVVGVIKRGVTEITPQAVADVLELIEAKTLYRGEEFESALRTFAAFQKKYQRLPSENEKAALLWANWQAGPLRIRNTAIGTLLQELSEGMDIETAVQRFERMVAPTNYKRPTAIITPKMIENAVSELRAQGLESALLRRHATLNDVSINNVLWADNAAQAHMKDALTDMLLSSSKARSTPAITHAQEISITDFERTVLPDAKSIKLFMNNTLQSNLVSITTAENTDAGQLFKWNNPFAWSYNGDITDSIKDRVKAAGGNTNATLRVSLAWFNGDDLDIHARCPDGHIYFANKDNILDVDMNAGGPRNSKDPVENLSWIKPKNGVYTIAVNQYSQRTMNNIGFILEVENAGKVQQFSYPHAVSGTVESIAFNVENGVIKSLEVCNSKIIGQDIARTVWNISTEKYIRVETVMNSPNHWDGQANGNKHWFFMLEGCKNPDACRGIYNEFLKPEMEPHRKVFEVLGSKTKAPYSEEQLSGVGFSSTKRDSVVLQVEFNNAIRTYKVNF